MLRQYFSLRWPLSNLVSTIQAGEHILREHFPVSCPGFIWLGLWLYENLKIGKQQFSNNRFFFLSNQFFFFQRQISLLRSISCWWFCWPKLELNTNHLWIRPIVSAFYSPKQYWKLPYQWDILITTIQYAEMQATWEEVPTNPPDPWGYQ